MKKIIEKAEMILEWGGVKKEIVLLCVSGIFLFLSILEIPMLFNPAWIAIILCGIPIIMEAIIGLITKFDIKADVLVSMALIAAVCIGEDFAAGEVAFIMQLGALLEGLTVEKARAGIEKLVKLTPQTARIIIEGEERIISAKEVKVGQIIRILSGESIPVDGIIISGNTSINQAVMTGESMPVDKSKGDEISSGTVNQFGTFDMIATKVGEDSSIQRMIKLVQSADADKAKIVGLADKWATWIVIIALTAALLTWIITGQIIRAVTILVVFCPCALVLATPTAIMAAIGNATKHGFLVREGDALERLAKVKNIAFDKTGTLTYGTPEVYQIVSVSEKYSQKDVFELAASAEMFSEHPLGKAIVAFYRSKIGHEPQKVKNFKIIPGRGVFAVLNDFDIFAGNKELMLENNIKITATVLDSAEKYLNTGCTIIYVSLKNDIIGFIALSDILRSDSKKMIKELKDADVNPVLLTGDHEICARTIADELGIAEVHYNCLPEDKLYYINKWEESNCPVCMIGDGINDAPALKKATVGIAMGGIGSDIAVDAADIALVNDEVKEFPHLIHLSKKMMITIKYNLIFSMSLNFLAIALAITGILNPVFGALVHNAGSVLVIINSAFLLTWKKKH